MIRGIKTSEFWLSVAVILGTIIANLLGKLPADTAAIITAFVGAIYTGSRGVAKLGGKDK